MSRDKKVLDELKRVAAKEKNLDVEKELTEGEMESVSGGCMCKCGVELSCGGGGGGQV